MWLNQQNRRKNSTLNKTSIEYHFKDREEQKSRIGLGPNLNNTNSAQTGVRYLHYSTWNRYSLISIQLKTETTPMFVALDEFQFRWLKLRRKTLLIVIDSVVSNHLNWNWFMSNKVKYKPRSSKIPEKDILENFDLLFRYTVWFIVRLVR